MSLQVKEGEVDFHVPDAGKPCKTSYHIVGDLNCGKAPLVVLHGGPGFSHGYLRPLEDLTTHYSTPVLFYDQLGGGESTHLPEKNGDTSFWTESLFKNELSNLLSALSITRYDILGHSWGGMLGSAFASERPAGLRRLIISNSPASMEDWVKDCNMLRSKLPNDVQATLEKHEQAGTTDSKEYQDAENIFYERHLCRVHPFPEELLKGFEVMRSDPTVYYTMNGPSEFHVTGSLKTWSVIDRLPNIEVPTFVINGRHDEAQDECVAPFFWHIPTVKWVTMDESSHSPMFDERERYMKLIADFLK